MVLGTGKPAFCLDNNFGSATPPEPSQVDRGDVDPVRTSSRCVFLTCDGKDCIAFLERCSWVISQGLCLCPGANPISYRVVH
jgi:hypothetical protein